jgi:predicted TIM-barrel fold metal-dependent hydrolase
MSSSPDAFASATRSSPYESAKEKLVVIDTETHIFYFARNSRVNPQETRRRHFTWHEHDADLLVQEMDHAGVDRTFLISYDGEDTRWAAEQAGFAMEDFAGGKKHALAGIREFPDRFYWFSVIKNPRLYDALQLVEDDIAGGAVGFKLFPHFLQARLTDPIWLEIFARLEQRSSRLLISFEFLVPGKTLTLAEYLGQLDAVLAEFPRLPIGLLHAGCADPLTPQAELVAQLCAKHPNVCLSTAMPGAIWDDGCEYPFPNLLRRVERLRDTVGADRLMWATDWPWFEDQFKYKQGIDCFRKHAPFLDESELEDFLGGTALRFLGDAA